MPPSAEREKNVYFRRKDQEGLAKRFDAAKPLFGSGLRFEENGTMLYDRWPSFSPTQDFVQISKLPPTADMSAPYTSYKGRKEHLISEVKTDGGSVETAIRNMEEIIIGVKDRDAAQYRAIAKRAHELLDLFSQDFAEITDADLERARQKTDSALAKVNLDPAKIVNEEKQRITKWLLKGSTGKDVTGRDNKLIAVGALSAAYTRAVKQQWRMGNVTKFIRMREAAIFERNLSRTIFAEVAAQLRRIEQHDLFKNPNRAPTPDTHIVLGLLRTMQFKLHQPHVKTYRPVGRQAETKLSQIEKLTRQNQRAEIAKLLVEARQLLLDELEAHKNIYPKPKKQ